MILCSRVLLLIIFFQGGRTIIFFPRCFNFFFTNTEIVAFKCIKSQNFVVVDNHVCMYIYSDRKKSK